MRVKEDQMSDSPLDDGNGRIISGQGFQISVEDDGLLVTAVRLLLALLLAPWLIVIYLVISD